MRDTRFLSPNGLDDRGRSTARDLLTPDPGRVRHPGFAPIVATKFRTIPGSRAAPADDPEPQRAAVALPGRDRREDRADTSAAGYCVIATAERDGRRLVAHRARRAGDAVLRRRGAPELRVRRLHRRTRSCEEGEPVRRRTRPRRARPGRGRRRSRGARPDRRARDASSAGSSSTRGPRSRRPPGERVGTLAITLPGSPSGACRSSCRRSPPPPPVDGGPWWARARAVVARRRRGGGRAVTDGRGPGLARLAPVAC